MIHLLLPITLYRPEEMRVIELIGNNMATYYVVQTYNPKLKTGIAKSQWVDLAEAISDAINWYSTSNVYEVERVRNNYKNSKIQIVDNLQIKQ